MTEITEIPETTSSCPYCGNDELDVRGCVTNCDNCGNEYHSCGD